MVISDQDSPPTAATVPVWLRRVSVPIVGVVVAVGVWVTGALLTNDETVAKGLTTAWFLVAGALGVLIAWRWRALALPVLGTYVVVSAALGGFLLYSSSVTTVVNEEVVVASEEPNVGRNVAVAKGSFVADAHPTRGTATSVKTGKGARVLTLTAFATDPGPDLRVYLVPSGRSGVDGGVDLGALKGNEGNQQYQVPDSAPVGTVVIWCRAFTVSFGKAALR